MKKKINILKIACPLCEYVVNIVCEPKELVLEYAAKLITENLKDHVLEKH